MEHLHLEDEASFPKFRELPKEIRLGIWEAAVPCPRLVDIRQKPLKIKFGEFEQQVKERKLEREQRCSGPGYGSVDEPATSQTSREESWLEFVNSDIGQHAPHLVETILERRKSEPMQGFKSRCRAPEILFVCRESYEVATRFYERSLDSVASIGETWFNFHRDILYIRWNKFDQSKKTDFDDLIYYIPYAFPEGYQRRIENLALLMNKKGIRTSDGGSLEEILAGILRAFGGVKTLILIAKHVGSYSGSRHNRSQLSLHDPIDTDYLEVHHNYAYSDKKGRHEMEIIHNIPELDIDWLQVDLEELQRLSEEITEERPTACVVPRIEYKIVVPDSYQPFLDWVEEKRVETLEWEKGVKERSRARK